ncbi:MAG: peptidyl-prolyl cis-trans isomerase [Candidatus Poribacteria bacterium]|nr:peptidyl-prolyl cis-trans isomerase [Candidatus Poribacteria bacterium]
MLKYRSLSIILLFAILATFPFILSCGDKAIGADGTVIAEFEWEGKHRITLEEMMQEISELPEYKQRQYKDKAGLEEYMLLMAESRLILSLAKDMKLNEDEEILKKVRDYLQDLMIERITEQEVDNKLVLDEADYKKYYDAHKEDYMRPAQVKLMCITLQNKERADEVFAELKAGKDIAVAAQELSDRGELVGPGANPAAPGDTDYIGKNTYPTGTEPFMDAAFEAELETLHPSVIEVEVQGEKYFMMFVKKEERDAFQRPFDDPEVRKNVVRKTERERRDSLMKEWLMQLRERAEVKTFIDRIPEDKPAEPEQESETPSKETVPEE